MREQFDSEQKLLLNQIKSLKTSWKDKKSDAFLFELSRKINFEQQHNSEVHYRVLDQQLERVDKVLEEVKNKLKFVESQLSRMDI